MKRISITVDGRPIQVEPGITVAAALLGAGLWRSRTSVEGEARGPLCGMGICFECRVTIDDHPQRRACMELCRDGMSITTHE